MELKRWCFNTDIRVFGTAMREHSRFSVLLNNSALTVKSAVLALKRPAPPGQHRAEQHRFNSEVVYEAPS